MKDKQKDWDLKIKELHTTVDKLGMDIDEGIIDVVAAMNLNGIQTVQSCEGHLDHGLAYPWVQIGSVNQNEIEEKREEAFKMRKKLEEKAEKDLKGDDYNSIHLLENEINLLIANALQKPIELINEFYRTEGPDGDEKLIVIDFADGGRLQPQGGILQFNRNDKDKKEKLDQYQHEIKRFGNFLKDLYFK